MNKKELLKKPMFKEGTPIAVNTEEPIGEEIIDAYWDESITISDAEKNDVLEIIVSLINFNEMKVKTDNLFYEKQIKDLFNKTPLLQTIIAAVKTSLIKGTSFLKLEGNLLDPRLYLLKTNTFSFELSTNKIHNLFAVYNKNFGNFPKFVAETYFEDVTGKYQVINSKRFKVDKVPYILFAPIKNYENRPVDIFWNTEKNTVLLDQAYRKLKTYLEYYNFYEFPSEEMIRNYGGVKNIRKQMANPIMNIKDSEGGEPFITADPSQQNIIYLIDILTKLTKLWQEKVNIQVPIFENANQKSEFEVEIQKQREINFAKRIKNFFEEKIEEIVRFYFDEKIEIELELHNFNLSEEKKQMAGEEAAAPAVPEAPKPIEEAANEKTIQ